MPTHPRVTTEPCPPRQALRLEAIIAENFLKTTKSIISPILIILNTLARHYSGLSRSELPTITIFTQKPPLLKLLEGLKLILKYWRPKKLKEAPKTPIPRLHLSLPVTDTHFDAGAYAYLSFYSLRVPTSCESSKPTKRRSSGKNLNLYDKFQKNGSRPLPIEFDYSSNLYRAEVPGDVKMSILTTLHNYFHLAQYHNTEYWDGIKLGIQADCANRYKDRKTKLKKHFDKEGGYDNTERAKQNPPKGMGPEEWVKEGGAPQHLEGWRDMHFKGSSGCDELNKAKSTSGGDDTPVDEVEVLQRSLGERRGHVRGVGRKVKSITPDLPPHMYHPAANELQQQLADANARWAEQQRINEMMQQQINKLMSMQGGQGSSSFYYPGFETNQEKDQEEEEDDDEDDDEDE
ncbi:hypothetical protein E3N88_03258 [Mikania micrantha]|uniref:Uncharacterized protein n=1 Tax=Mikania micrantha TaxID=192012 RepID=A0A5N6Q682_9ASTR|nr:hypothetical protein E3N88_03258 [Mikania micrantha]